MPTGILCVMCVLIVIILIISHYFLADNYTKYIGWMLYDKVNIHNTLYITLIHLIVR